MRITNIEHQFIKAYWHKHFPNSTVYLFGSRADNGQKGGDIDILVLNDEKITLLQKISFLGKFIKQMGERKVDLLTYTYTEETPFKSIALENAIKL